MVAGDNGTVTPYKQAVTPTDDFDIATKKYVDDNATGEINTASNVGTGDDVFKQKTGVDLEFRTLIGGTDITITQNANDLTIDYSGAAGVTPIVYFQTAAGLSASFTANATRYCAPMADDANNTSGVTRGELDLIFDAAYSCTRLRACAHNNTKDGATNVIFEDDAASVNTLVIAASTSGEFDSGAIAVTIAAGSKISWSIVTTASTSGAVAIRNAVAECEVT